MADERTTRRGFLGAAGAAIAGGLAGCTLSAPTTDTGFPTGGDVEPATPVTVARGNGTELGEGANANSPFVEVYQAVVDSVVAVRVQRTAGSSGGTAWIYNDDYIVTNAHVVGDSDRVSLWFTDQRWREGRVVGTDLHSDLAAITVPDQPDRAGPLPVLEEAPPVGTRVAAIGNPFGLSGSLTTGVVSGVNRSVPGPSNFSIPAAVQTDAAVNPGNSGGPLVTMDGEVVGVVNSGGGDNIGFAVSAPMVRRVVPALIEDGSYDHPFMGVELRDVTPPLVEANGFDVARGIYIHEVRSGSPSDGALQGSTGSRLVRGQEVPVGGDVVLSMDDTPIPTSQALSTFLALEAEAGDTVEVEILRDGERQTVDLTLGTRPEPETVQPQ